MIEEILNSPYRTVMAITGGGTGAIDRLLRGGGGSSTLIDARVPYGMAAMDEFLGGKPDKYCSPETARLMAMAAFNHAQRYEGKDARDLIGVGATCSLVKKGGVERAGRKHIIYVAAQTEKMTILRELELKYKGRGASRTRENEEGMAATLILNTLAKAAGIFELQVPFFPDMGEELIESSAEFSGPIQDVIVGRIPGALLDGTAVEPLEKGSLKEAVIFPGSFNPVHKNHTQMAQTAHELTGKPVVFEISVKNADKPAIDYISLQERLDGLMPCLGEKWCGGIALTNAPLFTDKAGMFPSSTFIVGFDTILRISNPKYYRDDSHLKEAIASFHRKGNKFLVFHRVDVENPVHPMLTDLVTVVDSERYSDDGTSSTTIRNGEKVNVTVG